MYPDQLIPIKKDISIKGILIDFGGVLVRTRNQELRRKWELHLGLPEGELSNLIFNSKVSISATMGWEPSEAVWKHVSETLKLNKTDLELLENDFWKYDELDEELVCYLQMLRPQMKIGILSNAWSDARELFLEKYKLGNKVDEIIVSAEERLAKPDPSIYSLAANRLNLPPDEIIFIDDVYENIEGASKAGMFGIQYKNTKDLITILDPIIKPDLKTSSSIN